jgi:Holliday junction resolvase RusA-like endonuclease
MTRGITFCILGQAVSAKNAKIQSVKHGRAFSFKNPKLEAFEDAFILQVPPEARQAWSCRVAVSLTLYYASDRPDLDPTVIYDLLQSPRQIGRHLRKGAGVIQNDRQIVETHAYKRIDAKNPRIEVRIVPVEWEHSTRQDTVKSQVVLI